MVCANEILKKDKKKSYQNMCYCGLLDRQMVGFFFTLYPVIYTKL